MKAQTSISILQVELDKLKNAYTDQQLQHERYDINVTRMHTHPKTAAGGDK